MNAKRVRVIKNVQTCRLGPVVYWMSRDQRAEDNWALIYAQQTAIERKQPLWVVFCLAPEFLTATRRQYGFMLRGLSETFVGLAGKNISCALIKGCPPEVLPKWLATHQAGLLVTDFDPLKIKRAWQQKLLAAIDIDCHEVDAHNIVPCWVVSPKPEFAAYTIRPKIQKLLPEYLEDFTPIISQPVQSSEQTTPFPELTNLISNLEINQAIGEVDWLAPGERAAQEQLKQFLRHKLSHYDTQSHDPTLDMQSNLSPYLHFGQLSAQRVAISILQQSEKTPAVESFLEELIVRRELADNFCHYNSQYDKPDGFPLWAQKTLAEHLDDIRDYCYSRDEFEQGRTHDKIWNAAQQQMVRRGKMHGYMRMYWAKKILEWSENPCMAQATAIYLNDKYELDGRDPNGYAGIAWSIGGVHDRAWGERNIFGKIRFMNDKGIQRKFDIGRYIDRYA